MEITGQGRKRLLSWQLVLGMLVHEPYLFVCRMVLILLTHSFFSCKCVLSNSSMAAGRKDYLLWKSSRSCETFCKGTSLLDQ